MCPIGLAKALCQINICKLIQQVWRLIDRKHDVLSLPFIVMERAFCNVSWAVSSMMLLLSACVKKQTGVPPVTLALECAAPGALQKGGTDERQTNLGQEVSKEGMSLRTSFVRSLRIERQTQGMTGRSSQQKPTKFKQRRLLVNLC
jgi:hypothetical protein